MTVGEASRLYQDQLEALRTARDRGWDHNVLEELERMVDRALAEIYNLWEQR